jgi:DNA-3-methyladenine glycosylase II
MDESLRALAGDARFAKLIAKYEKPTLSKDGNVFDSFIRSIVYQQLSGKAASTILGRFLALFNKVGSKKLKFPKPQQVLAISTDEMRVAGLSNQKALYLKDLALKFSDGTIKYKSLARMESDKIIEHLIQVKGVGVWTVQMFLIFTLGRLDVLPTGDLGIRKGMKMLYKLNELPNAKKMEALAKSWQAHASVASWYLWKLADEGKKK